MLRAALFNSFLLRLVMLLEVLGKIKLSLVRELLLKELSPEKSIFRR